MGDTNGDMLEPWKETYYIQDLDMAIGTLLSNKIAGSLSACSQTAE